MNWSSRLAQLLFFSAFGNAEDGFPETWVFPDIKNARVIWSNGLFPGGGNSNIFDFHPDPWGNDPIWLIFFKWVETTN